jgi:hypothetical protein
MSRRRTTRVPEERIKGTVSVGCPPPASSQNGKDKEWKSFQFHIHNFAALSTTKDHYIASPEFTCNGRLWELELYPGGANEATEGNVSAYLGHLSEVNITASCEIKILDKFGNPKKTIRLANREFPFSVSNSRGWDDIMSWGWQDFISRSVILDESQNILDSNGTLTVVVSIEEVPTTVFVPDNPLVNMIKEMFNDETTADVCFDVVNNSSADENEGQKKAKSLTSFHAHRLILKKCAPMLADLFGSNDTAPITDVKPDIFHHLLFYVYGGSMPEEDLKTHAKGIIDAADKYSIVNLKLEAEAAYVKSTNITLDNAIDNLLYADTKNCTLLKEAVMNFLAENSTEAAEKISFDDVPGHVVKDLLVVFSRNNKKDASGTSVDGLTTLCVSALRRKLHKMGLEVDGSREAMIASIKSNS